MLRRLQLPLLLTIVLLMLLPASAIAQEREPQAGGYPPLTEELAGSFRGYFEWLLDAQLTREQARQMDWILTDAWNGEADGDRDFVMQAVDSYDELTAYGDAERDLIHGMVLPEFLEQLRSLPEDETAAWLLGLYDAAHEPIAWGDPPLTRQASDAYSEAVIFMVSEAGGIEGIFADLEIKDAMAAYLAEVYPDYDEDQRLSVAEMPIYWAAIRTAWPGLEEEEREVLRSEWREAVAPLVDAFVAADEDAAEAGEEPEYAAGSGSAAGKPMSMAAHNTLMYMQQVNNNLVINNLRGNPFTYTPSYVTPPRY